jgi:hypothetical protein
LSKHWLQKAPAGSRLNDSAYLDRSIAEVGAPPPSGQPLIGATVIGVPHSDAATTQPCSQFENLVSTGGQLPNLKNGYQNPSSPVENVTVDGGHDNSPEMR